MLNKILQAAAIFATAALTTAVAGPALPETPAPVDAILYARPFELAEGFKFTWRQEQPLVTAGVLIVLKVDPALVYPRQTAEPVLYVGDTPAMRLNVGYPSGRLVALVPDVRSPDLDGAMIWFGSPRLPEQVDAATVAQEQALARQAGRGPAAAAAEGGPVLKTANLNALLGEAARLVRRFAPDEAALADSLASQGQ
jgi:hypothetical protein